MIKKVYSVFSKTDKDSSVFSAEDDKQAVSIALQVIFDSESFDEIFDEDGKLSYTPENLSYLYDVLKNYQLYIIASYDSEKLILSNLKLQDIHFDNLLDSFKSTIMEVFK